MFGLTYNRGGVDRHGVEWAGLGWIIVPTTGRLGKNILWACAADGPKIREKDKQKTISLDIAAVIKCAVRLL